MDTNKTIVYIVAILSFLFAFIFLMRMVNQYNEQVISRDNAAIAKGCLVVGSVIVCK